MEKYYKKQWEDALADVESEFKRLKAENARYREALEFYADEQNWFWDGTDNSEICSSDWDKDSEGLTFGGRRAREALKGGE